jgi:hypothetical protein
MGGIIKDEGGRMKDEIGRNGKDAMFLRTLR